MEKRWEYQFQINWMLKDETKINQLKKIKKNQLTLTFETGDSGHEFKINLIEEKS